MFRFVSMDVFFYYLIASFLCFNFNHIHAYHLRKTPDLLEEYYRNRGPPSNNDNTDSEVIWLNPGVLSNMKEFFDNLSSNMDSIDEEKSVLTETEADQPLKMKNPLTENYFRGYKPSYKIRNYVQSPDLGLLKGTNHHDPSLKWAGLGKRSIV